MKTSTHPRIDDKPWHRQFWPWFLIALPATVVVAAIITLIIASTGSDDLVAADYYKDGLAINERLGKEKRAQALGISAAFAFDSTSVDITLQSPFPVAALKLALSHPLEADRDFVVTAVRSGENRYRAQLPVPVGSRWHWSLAPESDSDWRLSGVLRAEDF